MPTTCIIVGCKKRKRQNEVAFLTIPSVRNFKHDVKKNELSRKRREEECLKAIKRADSTETKIRWEKVYSNHFITGIYAIVRL